MSDAFMWRKRSATAGSCDEVSYPDDDITAVMGADGQWKFAHKDGTPY
jgi:hypothetical protein